MTLSEARDEAAIYRIQFRDNLDPIAEARQRRLEAIPAQHNLMTFGDCKARYIDTHKAGWKNQKHTAQWSSTLKTYAGSLMDLPVGNIDTTKVLQCREPIWNTKTETATRVRLC